MEAMATAVAGVREACVLSSSVLPSIARGEEGGASHIIDTPAREEELTPSLELQR